MSVHNSSDSETCSHVEVGYTGVFTPKKLGNATNHCFTPRDRKPAIKYLVAHN